MSIYIVQILMDNEKERALKEIDLSIFSEFNKRKSQMKI